MSEALKDYGAGQVKEHASAAARASGEIVQLADGRAAVVAGLNAIAIGDPITYDVEGVFKVAAASGVLFSKGDRVFWDVSANTAIVETSATSADFFLGEALVAKVSGELLVVVDLNSNGRVQGGSPVLQSRVIEIDCQDGATNADLDLIPASQNPAGIAILAILGIVSEQFGGASEDQGIITVEDEDDTALGTLTAADSGADAVGDVLQGTTSMLGGSSGAAVKTVAAGKAVRAQVTQATSGASAAGKVKVRVIYAPLV